MNDNRFDLASAYLDGAVTPDERALAEADPEVMELVDQLRAVSSAMRDVDPPAADARERAIAAALTAAPATTTATAEVLPFTPRRRLSRVLSYAAAILAVGIVGSVVVTGLRGSGDDDISTSSDDVEMSSEILADDTFDTQADNAEAAREAFPSDNADAADAEDDADAGGDDEATSTMEAPAADSAEPSDFDSAEPSDVVELDRFTESEIAELVQWLIDEGASSTGPDERGEICPEVLDDVLSDPSLVTVYDGRPVVVGIAGELVRVVDPVECQVVVEVEGAHTPG
ncbi:hypothetical protein BH23ACT3_BH23ACT3_14450 [soil metagenome]